MAKKTDKQADAKVASLSGDGTAVFLGGETTAIGQDTLVQASLSLQVKDMGRVTITKGTATFSATAHSDEGTGAYAVAVSQAGVSGADVVHTRTKTSSYFSQEGSTSTWSETSTTRIFAVDVEGGTQAKAQSVSKTRHKAGDQADPDFDISGNIALMDGDVLVEGENTYAGIESSVLTVEDTLSTVSASITAGIA
jgi:hypothetical protein